MVPIMSWKTYFETPENLFPEIAPSFRVSLIAVAVALNWVGGAVTNMLRIPLWLDMGGTAMIAMLFGPWWGCLAGLLTNIVLFLLVSPIYLPYAVINMVGGIIIGYGAILGWTKTWPKFFALSFFEAIVSTTIDVPITVYMFGGMTGNPADILNAMMIDLSGDILIGTYLSNILESLVDKPLGNLEGLAVLAALPPHFRKLSPLAQE